MEKNVQNAKIAVIILSYNGQKYFPDLFRSLKEQTLQPSEVVIVDNNSADDSVNYIRKNFAEYHNSLHPTFGDLFPGA